MVCTKIFSCFILLSMSDKNKKKKYPGISAIFWIVFALILLILFLVNKNNILSVLHSTGFFTKVFGTEPEFIANHPSDDTSKPVAELESLQSSTTAEKEQSPIVLTAIPGNKTSDTGSAQTANSANSGGNASVAQTSQGQPAVSTETASAAAKKEQAAQGTTSNAPASGTSGNGTTSSSTTANTNNAASNAASNAGSNAGVSAGTTSNAGNASNAGAGSNGSVASTTKPAAGVSENPTPAAPSQMKQYLFFIQIDGDGSILRKESIRTIPKTTTPLTAAITALLDGPNLDEIEKGYISLIPHGTKLLGASVKNGTATINFSDPFRYNQYGVEGYYGQLMQIVYTATAFSNIDNVQFLIEGEKMDYLGLEGVYIGAPLSIASFH